MGSGLWLEKHGKCANISICRLERVVLAVKTYLCNRSTYLILNLNSSRLGGRDSSVVRAPDS